MFAERVFVVKCFLNCFCAQLVINQLHWRKICSFPPQTRQHYFENVTPPQENLSHGNSNATHHNRLQLDSTRRAIMLANAIKRATTIKCATTIIRGTIIFGAGSICGTTVHPSSGSCIV